MKVSKGKIEPAAASRARVDSQTGRENKKAFENTMQLMDDIQTQSGSELFQENLDEASRFYAMLVPPAMQQGLRYLAESKVTDIPLFLSLHRHLFESSLSRMAALPVGSGRQISGILEQHQG